MCAPEANSEISQVTMPFSLSTERISIEIIMYLIALAYPEHKNCQKKKKNQRIAWLVMTPVFTLIIFRQY